jgi:LysR family hydrogen peroxide-inducible transcriptional activator
VTLNELRYVVAVGRERHFGRAAEQCFISQPTLSVSIKKLEDELGVTLFERGQKELLVTPVGELIVEQAQRVLEEARIVRQLASHGKNQLAGTLRVGAIYTVGPYILPHMVPVMAELAPHMPLVLEENYTAVLKQRLKAGELDAILISLPFKVPGIVCKPLYREPFVVLVPGNHEWAARESVALTDLADENVLLLGEGHCFRDQVLTMCPDCLRRQETSESQANFQGSSLETIRYMVASGVGVTILPVSAARPEQFSRQLLVTRPIEGAEAADRCVALAWRANFSRPQAIDALCEAVRRCGLEGVDLQ